MCVNVTLAGKGPHVILLNPNQEDRLSQSNDINGVTSFVSSTTEVGGNPIGKDCRKTDPDNGNSCIYFNLEDNYIYDGDYPILHIAVEYYDYGKEAFSLKYDAANNVYETITVNRTNTNTWNIYTFDISDARFANRQDPGLYDFQLSDGGIESLYVSRVYVWCRKENDGIVTIEGTEFKLNGERYVPVGISWCPPWREVERSNMDEWWGSGYNSSLVERDLTNMEIAGLNFVRTHFHFHQDNYPAPGVFNSLAISNLQDFIQRAQNHGLKVKLSTGGLPNWMWEKFQRDYGGIHQRAEIWCNHEYRKFYTDWLINLLNEAIGGYESLFAFDFASEPSFTEYLDPDGDGDFSDEFYESLTAGTNWKGWQMSNAVLRAWNRWVNKEYAGLENAYASWGYQGPDDTNDSVYPEIMDHYLYDGVWRKKIDDYYRFIADRFQETTRYVKNRIQNETNSHALLTIDIAAGGGPAEGRAPTDPLWPQTDRYNVLCLTGYVKQLCAGCDFIALHIYDRYDLWAETAQEDAWWRSKRIKLFALGADKPVTLSEYGYRSEYENGLERQRKLHQKTMELAIEAGLDGFHGWDWIEPLYGSPDTFAITYNDTTPKPAYYELAQKKTPLLIADEPVPTCHIEVDRYSYLHPIENLYMNGQGVNLLNSLLDSGEFPTFLDSREDAPWIDRLYHLPVQNGDPAVGSLGVGALKGAVIIDSTIPRFMVAGGMSYSASVTVKNVGSTNWTNDGSNPYGLGTLANGDFPYLRWYLDPNEIIEPGQTRTFDINIISPAAPGEKQQAWKMLQSGITWFGESHEHTIKVIPASQNSSKIINHDIPNLVVTESKIAVSISVRNEGTETWTAKKGYKLAALDDSSLFTSSYKYLTPYDSIETGQIKTFMFNIDIPSEQRCYNSSWMMIKEDTGEFGEILDIEILAVEPFKQGDINRDGFINFEDFSVLAVHWLKSGKF